MSTPRIEIVPAILRRTYEQIEDDWNAIQSAVAHVQIDVTDGIFAGEGTFRELPRFKQLTNSEKIELHLMVHTPANFVDDVADLNPARCIFHLEAFAGTDDMAFTYETLRERTQAQLALAINPATPSEHVSEQLRLIDYVLFMGYTPGFANQPIDETVFNKIRRFHERHPSVPIAVDGHVSKETVERYVAAGATMLAANTAIFGAGDPHENLTHLQLLASAAAA